MASECPGSDDSSPRGVRHGQVPMELRQESHNELFDSQHVHFDHTYSLFSEERAQVAQCQLRNNEVLHETDQTTGDHARALLEKGCDNPNPGFGAAHISVPECATCRKPIRKTKKKGASYVKLISVIESPRVAMTVFPQIHAISPDTVICQRCYTLLRQNTRVGTGRKRELKDTATDKGVPPSAADVPPKRRKPSDVFKDTCHHYITASQYRKLVRLLMTNHICKQEMSRLFLVGLRKEMRTCPQSLCQAPSPENLLNHSWETTVEEVSDKKPVLNSTLNALFPKPDRIQSHKTLGNKYGKRKLSEQEANEILERRKGLVCAIAYYTHNPFSNRFMQAYISVCMLRQGASMKLFGTMNCLGLSQCHETAKAHAAVLRGDHDEPNEGSEHCAENGTSSSGEEASYSHWYDVEVATEARDQSNKRLTRGRTCDAEERDEHGTLNDNVTQKKLRRKNIGVKRMKRVSYAENMDGSDDEGGVLDPDLERMKAKGKDRNDDDLDSDTDSADESFHLRARLRKNMTQTLSRVNQAAKRTVTRKEWHKNNPKTGGPTG